MSRDGNRNANVSRYVYTCDIATFFHTSRLRLENVIFFRLTNSVNTISVVRSITRERITKMHRFDSKMYYYTIFSWFGTVQEEEKGFLITASPCAQIVKFVFRNCHRNA